MSAASMRVEDLLEDIAGKRRWIRDLEATTPGQIVNEQELAKWLQRARGELAALEVELADAEAAERGEDPDGW